MFYDVDVEIEAKITVEAEDAEDARYRAIAEAQNPFRVSIERVVPIVAHETEE